MKNQRKIDLIVVHCSATRINQDFPVEALEACHKARGFHSIGYHYYITKDGVVYPCRPESEEGAHARHYNAHSIGICYEGGLDEKGKPADTRTPAQKASLEDLLYSLVLDYPDAEILGHRDLPWVRKSCPCFDGISPLQRPHYFTSSYTYLFSKKSYFIIVFRVKDCLSALLHLIGFLYIVTWKHRLIVLIPIFHAGKDVFNIPSKV